MRCGTGQSKDWGHLFRQLKNRSLGPATYPIALPEPEPRAVGQLLIVPSIGSRDVACAEGPNIRRFEHFLKLLDVVNYSFNVHASQSCRRKPTSVNLKLHTRVRSLSVTSVWQSVRPRTIERHR